MEKQSSLVKKKDQLFEKNVMLAKTDRTDSNPFFMYQKSVKGSEITKKIIKGNSIKKKLLNVINSLLNIGTTNRLDELNINENPKNWINSIFSSYPNLKSEYVEFLLRDFTDSMNTKMKEDEKYVVAIMTGHRLILCHSKLGEESITPLWDVFERMLDRDNVIRYVSFEPGQHVKVSFFEKERTKFFIKWLGIPEKETFYEFGGSNRFYSYINNIPLSLEITDEDFEQILENNDFEIEGKTIKLNSPLYRLDISKIRRGSKTYENVSEFKEKFEDRFYDLAYYKEKYDELNSGLGPISLKIRDYEDKVKSTYGEFVLKKENQKFCILFCNDDIEMSDDFLEKIKNAIINNEIKRIYHPGIKRIDNPLKIGKLEIFHNLDLSLSKPLIKYYNEEDLGESYKKEMRYVIFYLMHQDNLSSPIEPLLEGLCKKFFQDLEFNSNINETQIIELKSKDFLPAKDKKLVPVLVKDIKKKLEDSDYKFYIIGYDEKIKEYEWMTDRFDDSRLFNLEKRFKEELKPKKLKLFKIKKDPNKCILMIVVRK